jgi:hypothetical protein
MRCIDIRSKSPEEFSKFLETSRIDLNELLEDCRLTPLIYCCLQNYIEHAEILLRFGADLFVKIDGLSVLGWSMNFCDFNFKYSTILFLLKYLEKTIKQGYPINTATRCLKDCVHLALKWGHPDISKLFFKYVSWSKFLQVYARDSSIPHHIKKELEQYFYNKNKMHPNLVNYLKTNHLPSELAELCGDFVHITKEREGKIYG